MTGYRRLPRRGRHGSAWTEFVEAGQPAAPVREVGDFQPDVIKLAKLCGWRRILHIHDSRKSEGEGFPDLLMIRDGKQIAAELKVGANTTTPEQRNWLESFEGVAGCVALVWRPTKAPKTEKWWRVETSEGADWGAIGRRLRGET